MKNGYRTQTIAEGVTLFVYDNGEGALELGDSQTIEFRYTEEVANLFEDEKAQASDLLGAIANNTLY